MQNKPLRSLTFLILSGIVLSLTAWAITSSPRQDQQAKQTDGSRKRSVNLDHVPIVDYEKSAGIRSPEIDPQARALRSAKGERYAKHIRGLIVDRDTDQGMILASRNIAPLPALPVGRSVAVVLGEIVDAQAYLSDDKTGVYSEFSVRVEEIFKNDSITPVYPGSLVTTERYVDA